MVWDNTKPADNEKVSLVPGLIRANFTALETAWNGDHTDITSDGSASITHEKVTLPKLAADPAAIAQTGIVYTKLDGSATELYYRDAAGNIVQLTKSGSISGGADASCSFDGGAASPITPSNEKNVTSITRNATGNFTVNFTTAFSDANYAAIIMAKPSSSSHSCFVDTITKAAGTLNFTLKEYSYITSALNAVNSSDINVVIFKN